MIATRYVLVSYAYSMYAQSTCALCTKLIKKMSSLLSNSEDMVGSKLHCEKRQKNGMTLQ